MKKRRHHNNKGARQVKRGTHLKALKRLGRELRVPVRG